VRDDEHPAVVECLYRTMATVTRSSSQRLHQFPPVIAIVGVLLLLLAVLPSALNVPHSNPTETLEYAPVPPNDETPPQQVGNLSSLGLAGSSSLASSATGSTTTLPLDQTSGGAGSPTAGRTPSTKRCVGNPPRQTEDPLAPPCVAHFAGDNFGATYAGVTREEVRVVVYFEGCGNQLGSSSEAPKADEPTFARTVRMYQRYFNERYQTYGRFVHFWAYFDAGAGDTPERRRADAADAIAKIKPFGAMLGSAYAYASEWENFMARRGVIVFRSAQTERARCCTSLATFEQYAPRMWSVAASTEEYAAIVGSAMCKRVVGRQVTFSGMPEDQGKPRRLGIIRHRRPAYPDEARFSDLVSQRVEGCGGRFVEEGVNTGNCDNADVAAAAMARFQQAGITTIIWPAGPDPAGDDCGGLNFTNAAGSIGYLPEVVVAGSGESEITLNGQVLNQSFWRNAFVITPYTRADVAAERPCFQAGREADPDETEVNLQNFGCPVYDAYRLLFTGIQVAGPRLGPTSMDKGFHAIPGVSSPDPRVPACFFHAGDYSCVKDAMIEWWDPSGRDPGSQSRGCMRMVEGGARYLEDTWPDQDIAANRRADDPCNRQGLVLG
jgi:hypothetical protein